jgi:hypothetical protein
MTKALWSRDSERRWRHLVNWLWVSPVVFLFISGSWYAATKNIEGPVNVIFLPWWLLISGILSYVLVTISKRFGSMTVIIIIGFGGATGIGIWFLAGIQAAIWCGLIVPLLLGSGCVRLPPQEIARTPSSIIAVILGIAEPLLILTCVLATTMLIIHYSQRHLPGWYWWWLADGVALPLLVYSFIQLQHWRRLSRAASQTPALREPV